jgi:hypothetical protein
VVAEVEGPGEGCAADLARASGGTRIPLSQLAAGLLVETVEVSG